MCIVHGQIVDKACTTTHNCPDLEKFYSCIYVIRMYNVCMYVCILHAWLRNNILFNVLFCRHERYLGMWSDGVKSGPGMFVTSTGSYGEAIFSSGNITVSHIYWCPLLSAAIHRSSLCTGCLCVCTALHCISGAPLSCLLIEMFCSLP